MARVQETVKNDIGEVTGVIVKKGSTGEILKRHSTMIIPLLQSDIISTEKQNESDIPEENLETVSVNRSKRKAAVESQRLTREILANE